MSEELKTVAKIEEQERAAVEVTNRSSEEHRTVETVEIEERTINLELTVDSDLRVISNLSADEFNKMLSNTALNGLGNTLEQAEKEHSVNGLYLMGLACIESAYGTSSFARNRNNLVGWGAYDSNPNSAKYFNSKDECILYVAEKLKNNYLTEGACYFNGYSAKAVDIRYCTDKQHANKIINIVNNLKGEL